VRVLLRAFVLIAGLCVCTQFIRAQETDVFLGFGSAHVGSNHQRVDTFGDGVLYPTKGIGGLFADFGANILFGKHLGAGFDASWRGAQATYTGLKYRPLFYSFDAIVQPGRVSSRKFVPEFRAGIGAASLNFAADAQQACVNGPGCQNSHHFQVHSAAAVRIYVATHLFVRPAIDVHYVNNFSEFGSNWVPLYSIAIGYSLGRE
jgi:hypothetical protein